MKKELNLDVRNILLENICDLFGNVNNNIWKKDDINDFSSFNGLNSFFVKNLKTKKIIIIYIKYLK